MISSSFVEDGGVFEKFLEHFCAALEVFRRFCIGFLILLELKRLIPTLFKFFFSKFQS